MTSKKPELSEAYLKREIVSRHKRLVSIETTRKQYQDAIDEIGIEARRLSDEIKGFREVYQLIFHKPIGNNDRLVEEADNDS